jgi:hypothetical protein
MTLIGVAAAGWWVLPVAFGARYSAAYLPLVILTAGGVLIGMNGVIGTLLIASRRARLLGIQVGASLVVNLLVGVPLAARMGATGVALATLATETVATVILLLVVARVSPGAILEAQPSRIKLAALSRVRTAPALGISVITATLLLELWAERVRYGLRVIADTPTYLSLLRELALHPFRAPSSPFVNAHVNLAHATPDLQALAFIWNGLAAGGVVHRNLLDIIPAYQLLAVKGMLVTLVIFHALHLWVRRQTGSSRIAWLTVAVLPFVWGPALIVSPGDFSINGFMSTADHSEALAIALMLYALVVLDMRPTARTCIGGVLAVSAVMVTHPFTGVRMAALVTAVACLDILCGGKRGSWKVTPPALLLGFALASQWPEYNLSDAMLVGPFQGWQLIVILAAAPYMTLGVVSAARRLRLRMPTAGMPRLDTSRAALIFAVLGLGAAVFIAARELWLYAHPDPFLQTNRPSIYWGGSSLAYWPLLLAPGAAGLIGLVRNARWRRSLPLVWGVGCIMIGIAGSAGVPIPLWHRFALFAQIPIALGVAVILADAEWKQARRVVVATLLAATAFSLGTLTLMPHGVTYLGNAPQAGWFLNRLVPQASSTVIASDPASSYFVLPLGDRTLTMTTWHIGGPSELLPARRGYLLIHRVYVGDDWRSAARSMWQLGVRYVIANRGFRMQSPTLDKFSSFNAPYLVRSWKDQEEVNAYLGRLAQIATETGSLGEYHAYRLDPAKLFPSPQPGERGRRG